MHVPLRTHSTHMFSCGPRICGSEMSRSDGSTLASVRGSLAMSARLAKSCISKEVLQGARNVKRDLWRIKPFFITASCLCMLTRSCMLPT